MARPKNPEGSFRTCIVMPLTLKQRMDALDAREKTNWSEIARNAITDRVNLLERRLGFNARSVKVHVPRRAPQ